MLGLALPLRLVFVCGVTALSSTIPGGTGNSIASGASKMPLPCKSRMVHDFAGPLRGLPTERAPSETQLRFAPVGVSLKSVGLGRPTLQGSPVGYELSLRRAARRNGQFRYPVRLNWVVYMTLWRINREGTVLHVVDQKRRKVGTLREPGSSLFTLRQSKRGFYRFDLTIRGVNGRLVKSYRQYVRMLPRRVKLRIATNQTTFHAGEVAIGQIQNLGTLPAFLVSLPYLKVERFSDDMWSELSSNSGDVLTAGPERVVLGDEPTFAGGSPFPLTEARGTTVSAPLWSQVPIRAG